MTRALRAKEAPILGTIPEREIFYQHGSIGEGNISIKWPSISDGAEYYNPGVTRGGPHKQDGRIVVSQTPHLLQVVDCALRRTISVMVT